MNLSAFRPAFRPVNLSKFRTPTAAFPRVTQKQPWQAPRIPANTSSFSSTARMERRSKGGKALKDPRVTAIRYHLTHPLTPRPLRFSRNRQLRHWTIHRAWLLFLRKRRWAEERELERMYTSMRDACEHLRLLDNNGNRVRPEEAGAQGADAGALGPKGKEVGKLYRKAMSKKGVWGSVPIEYAKLQTDFPSRDGWNHAWTRQ
ncbi:hypothetical protein BS50DRAFT_610233 [Corynespora cassiicola Philippines]|uniref:Uncharacterized protein n=1 Tax=Corynespora cassiicola Philippines TaxID=1448308 RepID=A0A2T2NN45_CORCC|nr:hypothetical protein BS50DRAFT_610233 [Corynespora cassiicola Philippines]